jgi:hypothetical protein
MSPVLPVTVNVYEPFAPEATVNDPETIPPEIVHEAVEMSPVGDEDSVQLVSPATKFDPDTATLFPPGAEVGVRVTAGETKTAVSVIELYIVIVTGLLVPE